MTVDSEYYYDCFGGTEQADIDRLLLRAEKTVNSMILISPNTELQEKAYKDAVCAQAEYMGMCGGLNAWILSSSGSAQSYTVGSFSMSTGNSGSTSRSVLCKDAVSYLEISGLLERRCNS